MTGDDNTKVCNNKTLLGTCMLVSIVCMLSVGDVFGAKKKPIYKPILLPADYLIQQIENDSTMYERFKYILINDARFNIKYKKRCYCCCDTNKIDFKETTMYSQNDDNHCNESLEWYMGNTFYYYKTSDNIVISKIPNFEACTNLDNFIAKNITAPKVEQ